MNQSQPVSDTGCCQEPVVATSLQSLHIRLSLHDYGSSAGPAFAGYVRSGLGHFDPGSVSDTEVPTEVAGDVTS